MSTNANPTTEYDSVKLMYVEMARMRESYDLELKNMRQDIQELKMENLKLNKNKFDSASLRELWKEVTTLRTQNKFDSVSLRELWKEVTTLRALNELD